MGKAGMQDVPLTRRVFFALVLATGLAAGCSDREGDASRLGLSSSKLSGTVRISGSTTMAPMIGAMTKEFQKQQPGVSFDLRAGGSGQGLKDVKEGKTDIGMVSRTLTSDERDWLPFVVARDGIAVSVHADNPVSSLSDEQVAAIYTKKILNWREVGGRDAPISVVGASLEAGSTELFLHQFRIKHGEVRPDVIAEANADRFAAMSGNPNTIVYSSLGEAERRTLAGEKVKPLPSAGIAATSANLAAGRYAVARPLTLVTKGLPSGPAKAFIDYVRSAAAIPIIDRFEFVPYRD
jgi:phosphate transport system substrate-binding protein